MKKKGKNFNRNIIMSVLLIGLLISVFYFSTQETILGVSTYQDNQDKTHWLINGVADNVDEGYTFKSLPNTKRLSDGTEVRPQEEAVLFISKKESYCEYQLNRVEIKRLLFPNLVYYELNAPSRVALVDVKDDSGNTKSIDGTVPGSLTFYDNDGQLTFKTIGVIASKQDCQEGSNVAIRFSDGNIKVLNENQLLDLYNGASLTQISTLFRLTSEINNLASNSAFLNNFADYNVEGTSKFIGDVNIGSVQFTIDADQDYYNSFIYTPPKETKPEIVSINLPSSSKIDESFSANVLIRNQENNAGSIRVEASVNIGSVSPSITNIITDNSGTSISYNIKNPNNEFNGELCIEACSVNEPNNCDNKCKSYKIEKDAEITCGNGVCDNFESFTTCPTDCEKESTPTPTPTIQCSWYQEEFTNVDKDYGFLFYRALVPFLEPKTTEFQDCKTAGWIYLLTMGVIILILGLVIVNRLIPKKKGGKKRK